MKLFDTILPFAKDLVWVDDMKSPEAITTIMLATGVSTIPIIRNNGTVNAGVIRRKTVWEYMVRNSGKVPDTKDVKESALPEVCKTSTLPQAMKTLLGTSGVLFKDTEKKTDKYTHYISPRVVANALNAYSVSFQMIEKVEKLIRERLKKQFSIDEIQRSLEGRNHGPPPGVDPLEGLTFANYHWIISKLWDGIGLGFLDRRDFLKRVDIVRDYRNDVMHFRVIEGDDRIEHLKELERLLGPKP
jgi:hypothetical protein